MTYKCKECKPKSPCILEYKDYELGPNERFPAPKLCPFSDWNLQEPKWVKVKECKK